ncbi:hypothetical protein BC827DRAFT_1264146 [Russula dissimulans]|nr:hypothetical protein BC827DRAFT_1264146 [Russula dissimulans]
MMCSSPTSTVSPIPAASPTSSPGPSSTPHDMDLKQSTHGPGSASVPGEMPLPLPAAPTFTAPDLSDQSTGPQSRDFLPFGYISHTFTPQLAETHLAKFYKVDPKTVTAYQDRSGAYLVFIQPSYYSPPSVVVQGQPAWILDYKVRSGGTVVPQHLWSPQGQGDWRQYVEQVDFHMPVFFINANGSLGVPLVNAAAGQMSLRGADQLAPLGDKTTTKIRIGWPGYHPSESQVQLRDQTPARNPIPLERLVKHVASRVRQFLIECEHVPVQGQPHKWTVGHGNITFSEVMLIGVIQVSAGSWMPILQLMSRVVL